MKRKTVVDSYTNGIRLRIEEIRGEDNRRTYPIRPQAWHWAVRLMNRFGSTKALELIDQRAWRAYDRGDGETSRRWRDLIIAIHAMEEDELPPGERAQ